MIFPAPIFSTVSRTTSKHTRHFKMPSNIVKYTRHLYLYKLCKLTLSISFTCKNDKQVKSRLIWQQTDPTATPADQHTSNFYKIIQRFEVKDRLNLHKIGWKKKRKSNSREFHSAVSYEFISRIPLCDCTCMSSSRWYALERQNQACLLPSRRPANSRQKKKDKKSSNHC